MPQKTVTDGTHQDDKKKLKNVLDQRISTFGF